MDLKELEFTRMVKEQKNTIYTVCMMFSGESSVDDLVQQTLINLWKGYDGFRGDSAIGTWVWKVAMNTCITADKAEKKRNSRKARLEDTDISGLDISTSSAEDRQIRMLHDRIGKLGIFDRAIVLLWLEDLSYEEIGEIVGISADNVSVRLVRIREQLRKM